jgi:hypothetical protein
MRVRMTGKNLEVLERMKRRLAQDVQTDHVYGDNGQTGLVSSQWKALQDISEAILEACKERDIEEVAASTRKMKQRLRRRHIRRALRAIESSEGKPDGECKCSKCGAVLDGSEGPCLDNVLCTKCALEKDPNSDKARDQETKKNGSSSISAKPKEDEEGSGADKKWRIKNRASSGGKENDQSEKKEKVALRRRGY